MVSLGVTDFGQNIAHALPDVIAASFSSLAFAAPLSIDSAAMATPADQIIGLLRHDQGRRGIEQHRVAIGAGRAGEQVGQRLAALSSGVPPRIAEKS